LLREILEKIVLDELPSLNFIKEIIPIAKAIGILEKVKIVDSLTFQNVIEKSIIREKFNSYQRLRLVEGYYCSQEINIPKWKKIISNRQFYASKIKDNDFTMNLISEIKKRHTTMYPMKSTSLPLLFIFTTNPPQNQHRIDALIP